MGKVAIAIDGPSGAGKSTIAKLLAKELGFIYVDTGAIYRTVGLYVFRKGLDPADEEQVVSILPEVNIELTYKDGVQCMFLNGEDVSGAIREHQISSYASKVSAHPPVRAFLLEKQRDYAKKFSVIMDGRDIGTVVLPDAEIKIFLTASSEDRANRRYLELIEKGQKVDFETVHRDIKERDFNDANRATAPLKAADDAIVVDTSGNTLEQSVELLRNIVKERL
ncbi:MAG: (d)CMP kinase [Clostridia bacterium]|nr:(d)CMP kinase [Clostridia bacterium]